MSGNVGTANGNDRVQIYQDHARNVSENFNGVVAVNQALNLHVEEAGEAFRDAQQEIDQLRALNRRAAVVLRESSAASQSLIFTLVVVVIVGVVAALFFTGIVPVWAIALALGLGAISLLAYWGYEWYTSNPNEPVGLIGYSATPLETPSADEARNGWLASLQTIFT